MNFPRLGEFALRTLIRIGIAQSRGVEVTTAISVARGERLPLRVTQVEATRRTRVIESAAD